MDIEKAREILEMSNYHDISGDKHTLIDGVAILAKYNDKKDKFDFHSEHDQLWFMDFESTVEKMSEEDVIKLEELNRFEDENSWSIFT